MKTKDDVVNWVLALVRDQLNVERDETEDNKFTSASKFSDWGGDSLDLIESVVNIERQFDISIADEDVEKFICVDNIVEYLVNKKL